MNETLWLTCRKPAVMLAYLSGRVTPRKKRLLCVACCRTVPHLQADPAMKAVLDAATAVADGTAAVADLLQAARPYTTALQPPPGIVTALSGVFRFDDAGADLCGYVAHESTSGGATVASLRDALIRSYSLQADLVRDIVGNPFRPVAVPPSLPGPIPQLAAALYAGEDVAFALYDAFLDAALPELAEHFREGSVHPNGCWLVDRVLGKA